MLRSNYFMLFLETISALCFLCRQTKWLQLHRWMKYSHTAKHKCGLFDLIASMMI